MVWRFEFLIGEFVRDLDIAIFSIFFLENMAMSNPSQIRQSKFSNSTLHVSQQDACTMSCLLLPNISFLLY